MEKESILNQIREQTQGHSDIILNTQYLNPTILNENKNEQCLQYSRDQTKQNIICDEWALQQLMNRFSVPLSFYRRCTSPLQEYIFAEHIQAKKRDLLFRLSNNPGLQYTMYVRAILSHRYSPVDNLTLFPEVFKALEQYNSDLHFFTSDNHFTILSAKFNDLSAQSDDQTYTAGIRITNSETGRSSVWIEPLVSTPRFDFVNRTPLHELAKTRIIHRGKIQIENVHQLIQQAREVAQVGIIQLVEARTKRLQTQNFLLTVENEQILTPRLRGVLAEKLANQQEVLAIIAAESILELAEQLPLFQRLPAEQLAGSIIGIFQGYKTRLANILTEKALRDQRKETNGNQ